MQILKQIAVMGVCTLLVVLAVVFWGKSAADLDLSDKIQTSEMPTEGMKKIVFEQFDSRLEKKWTIIAKTDYLILSISESDGTIQIYDIRSQKSWLSTIDKADENITSRLNDVWIRKLNSLLEISYYDSRKNTGIPIDSNPYQEETYFGWERTQEGVLLKYAFKQAQIQLSIQIELSDDRLTVKVPFDSIKEFGYYRLAKIELLPVFGASKSDEDGYIMYPDGSGAISYFDSSVHTNNREQIKLTMYGRDIPNFFLEDEDKMRGIKQAMLPVYGMKRANSAYLAFVDNGSADCEIIYSPAGYVVNLNRIHASFVYRRVIDMSILSSGREQQKIFRYQNDIQIKDVQVSFIFLDEDNANYSGMAEACRNHMQRNKLLPDANIYKENTSFALNFLMGIQEEGGLIPKYHSMTNFQHVDQIVRELSAIWDGNLIVHLSGWARNGLDVLPTPPKIDSRIGGKRGLIQLVETINEIGGRLFLNVDVSAIRKGDGRKFSLKNDVVYLGNTLQATDATGTLYRLRYNNFFNHYARDYFEMAENLEIGLSFEGIGSQLYADYPPGISREDMLLLINERLNNYSEQGMIISGEGNLYMLQSVSHLFNIPERGSGYILSDTEIPFYQMVIHGVVPYIGEPGNLAHDLQWQKLRWIEQGSIPNFYITYSSAENLKFTSYNKLFSSSYITWKEAIIEMMNELNPLMNKLSGLKISQHRILGSDVVEVVYEDGTAVIINYRNSPVLIGNNRIEALEYIVTDDSIFDGEVIS